MKFKPTEQTRQKLESLNNTAKFVYQRSNFEIKEGIDGIFYIFQNDVPVTCEKSLDGIERALESLYDIYK